MNASVPNAPQSSPSGALSSDLDPFSPEFRADPFPRYAQLREIPSPAVWLAKYAIWVVSRYEPVRAVLTDWKRFSNAGGGGLSNYFLEPPWRPPSLILEVDPPAHQRTRKVLMQALSTERLQSLRARFEAEADHLIESALERGVIDAIPDLVQRFPLTVFPDAVGMPREDRSPMLTYGAMVFGGFGPSTPWHRELMQSADAVSAWIMARCQRAALASDGIGAAIHAQADLGEIQTERRCWSAPCSRPASTRRSIRSDCACAASRSIRTNGRCCDKIRILPDLRSRRRRASIPRASPCSAPRSRRSSSKACPSANIKRSWC
jgi:cytochrome P450